MSDRIRFDEIQTEIRTNIASAEFDLRERLKAIRQLEHLAPGRTRTVLFYMRLDRALSRNDVLPFQTMLNAIGRVWNLDLILIGPGGDGLAAETLLGLCRKYCTRRLRAIVPLYAKSAITLLALGADQIVMGESSELGPIDAQVYIIQDNQDQQVSADHFLRAEREAIKALGAPEPEEQQAARIKLAQLSPAFLAHCRDLMKFSHDFAGTQLRRHMFKSEVKRKAKLWKARIDKIVEKLASSSKHLHHGRMITAEGIKADPDLKHLKVQVLKPAHPYWLALQELLVRTEVIVQRHGDIGKVLFATDTQMMGG